MTLPKWQHIHLKFRKYKTDTREKAQMEWREFYVYISCPFVLFSAFSFQLLLKVSVFQSCLSLYRFCPFYPPGRSHRSMSHCNYPSLHDLQSAPHYCASHLLCKTIQIMPEEKIHLHRQTR